jgi:hypothetical protein
MSICEYKGTDEFMRCAGCPAVKKGEKCEILDEMVSKASGDWGRIEFICGKVIAVSGGRENPVADGKVTVTPKGATYGAGKAGDELVKKFFG